MAKFPIFFAGRFVVVSKCRLFEFIEELDERGF
jgi:hypothetical protein